jgi:hypothetical protein
VSRILEQLDRLVMQLSRRRSKAVHADSGAGEHHRVRGAATGCDHGIEIGSGGGSVAGAAVRLCLTQ